MKTEAIKWVCKAIASCLLLSGMVYSVPVLTAEPAYTASCNCSEAFQDAGQFCLMNFGHPEFSGQCFPDQGVFLFTCTYDPSGETREVPCD